MSTAPSNINISVADSISQVQGEPSTFAMYGAREILALTADAVHIEQQIKALEDAVVRNPSLAFDLSKTIIESVCKTILRDRGQTVSEDDDLSRLFGMTLERLRVLPDAHTADAETGRSIRRTTGGLHTVIQGICELRNRQGFASHGKLAETQPLESVQAELVARAADAVVSFLFKAHRSYAVAVARPRRTEYKDNESFNTFVDEANEPVGIFSLTYRPSEVLYNVDYQAYVDLLNSYSSEQSEEVADAGPPEVSA